MRGDGMQGLAIAIFVATIFMVITSVVLFGWLGNKVGARPGLIIGALLGLTAGVISVLATFFESTFSPEPRITIMVPQGFKHEWVLIIPDPNATQKVVWEGSDLPFTSRHTQLRAPMSGVVRVKDLGSLDGDDVRATLSNGKTQWGKAALQAPPGVGSGRLLAYNFAEYPGTEVDISLLDEAALAQLIAKREAER